MRFLCEHTEEPVYPLRIATTSLIDRLKRLYTLDSAPDRGLILVNRVTSEHPENRYRYRSLGGLGWHIAILAAWVEGSVPVASPKGVTVSPDLVFTHAGSVYRIFLIKIFQSAGIDEP